MNSIISWKPGDRVESITDESQWRDILTGGPPDAPNGVPPVGKVSIVAGVVMPPGGEAGLFIAGFPVLTLQGYDTTWAARGFKKVSSRSATLEKPIEIRACVACKHCLKSPAGDSDCMRKAEPTTDCVTGITTLIGQTWCEAERQGWLPNRCGPRGKFFSPVD